MKPKWEFWHECFATDRFQATLVRESDLVPRELNNEAEKGEQQRHNSPQLTLSFSRCAFQLFVITLFFLFFFFLFFYFLLFSCFWNSFSMHARHTAARLVSLTWNEKWKAWHSFSLTKATGTLALPFCLSRHHVRHVLWRDSGGMCARDYRGLSSIFVALNRSAKEAIQRYRVLCVSACF